MRLLLTSDLHYNHGRTTALADEVIEKMNRAGGDAVVLIGDTAIADGDYLERALARFTLAGPKLFVAGNHELWTKRADSHDLFLHELPRRVRELGWIWLEDGPFVAGDVAVVGSVGWYDYSFAPATLEIPERFYVAKTSPGAAVYVEDEALLGDLPPDHPGRQVMARWNDGKFVKLHRPDAAFLEERLSALRRALDGAAARGAERVIAAVHHLPFKELLPPLHRPDWDFAQAYLGSPRIGALLQEYDAVTDVFCGHSHFPATATVGGIRAENIGSGYRAKFFKTLEV